MRAYRVRGEVSVRAGLGLGLRLGFGSGLRLGLGLGLELGLGLVSCRVRERYV